jgi:hypothetical protein
MAFVTRFSIIKLPDNLSDWTASQTYRSRTLFFCVHLRNLNIGFPVHKRIELVEPEAETVFQLAL